MTSPRRRRREIPNIAIVIPIRLFMDKDLNPLDMIILGLLAATSGTTPTGTILSRTQIATIVGKPYITCTRAFKRLKDLGYVTDGRSIHNRWCALALTKKFTKLLDVVVNVR